MFQHDLFPPERCDEQAKRSASRPLLDLPAILERLTASCERPRYSFMVLNLIAQAGARSGSAGPHIREGDTIIPIRDRLCDALLPVAQRDPRRLALSQKVRRELEAERVLPADPELAQRLVDEKVGERLRRSGRTNVSRAVSELVRAGLVTWHYQGYRFDHRNRGAKRQAVYTVVPEARSALGSGK